MLTLTPLDNIFATENDDDELGYHTASYLKQPFNFGGEKAGISLNKGILSVPFCGSLNLNEFAVQHFDRHEPDFHMLWYNIAPDSDWEYCSKKCVNFTVTGVPRFGEELIFVSVL